MVFLINPRYYPLLRKSRGFSLIELIAVVIIVGVLSTTAMIHFSSTDTHLQAAKSDVLATLVFAREMAMARSGSLNQIQVIVSATSIDIQHNSVSQSNRSQDYPLSFPSGVQITSGTGTLDFNALGETSTHSIVFSQAGQEEVITISGTGYAY